MLELIFQGFIEWLYSLVLECWNWLSSSLLDIMSLDLAYIRSHVPIITDIMQALLAVGWALLLGNLVFQALKGMAAGLGFEAEDPKMLFGRSAVFSFLLLASPQLCEIVLDMTSRVITLLELPDAINVHLVDASILGNLLAGWLVVIICNFIVMWKVLKLLLKIAEQYVVLSTLTIAAPLAFAMGGSKSTAPIFSGWCRMYGSMCLLMVSNVMFFKMLLSVMSAIPSGLDVIPWMVLIFSIVKVAKRMDDTITRIGLNPAQTGASGGRSLPGMVAATVMHGAVSQVTKTIGGALGGALGTAGKGAVGTGAAAATGLSGVASILRPGRGRGNSQPAGGQQSNSQQVYNQQNGGQQSSAQQANPGAASIPASGSQQSTPPSGGTSTSTASTSASQSGKFTSRHSRKSAVPSGTQRGTSYVPPADSGSNTSTNTDHSSSSSEETAARSGGFGGGSRGGTFGSSRSGGFGGGRRGTFGSDSEHSGGFGGGRGGTFGSERSGGFGGSRASRTGGRDPQRSGGFGGDSRRNGDSSGASGGRQDVRSSTAGTAPASTAERTSSRSFSGAAPVPKANSNIRRDSPHSGTAGTPGAPASKGGPLRGEARSGSAAASQPGTAGTERTPASVSSTVKNGAVTVSSQQADTARGGVRPEGAPSGAAASAPTRSTRYQAADRENRRRSGSGSSAAPAAGAAGAPTGKPAAAKPAEARSTRRESVHSERTTVEHNASRQEASPGAAGTAASGSMPQSVQTPQTGRLVPPKRQGASPVPQEARQTSVPAKQPAGGTAQPGKPLSPATPPASGGAPHVQPGTAGTVPEHPHRPQKRQTARKEAKREQSKAEIPAAPPGRRTASGLTPPAKKSAAGLKRPDRSGHNGGGGHGG